MTFTFDTWSDHPSATKNKVATAKAVKMPKAKPVDPPPPPPPVKASSAQGALVCAGCGRYGTQGSLMVDFAPCCSKVAVEVDEKSMIIVDGRVVFARAK